MDDHNLDRQVGRVACARAGERQLPFKSMCDQLSSRQGDTAKRVICFQWVFVFDNKEKFIPRTASSQHSLMVPLRAQIVRDNLSFDSRTGPAGNLTDAIWIRLANPVRIAQASRAHNRDLQRHRRTLEGVCRARLFLLVLLRGMLRGLGDGRWFGLFFRCWVFLWLLAGWLLAHGLATAICLKQARGYLYCLGPTWTFQCHFRIHFAAIIEKL